MHGEWEREGHEPNLLEVWSGSYVYVLPLVYSRVAVPED